MEVEKGLVEGAAERAVILRVTRDSVVSREPGKYLESPTQQPVRLTEFRQVLTGCNER